MKTNHCLKLKTIIQNGEQKAPIQDSKVYHDPDLFFCLIRLLLDANKRGKVRTSYRELSIALNLSNKLGVRRTVRRLLSRLEKAGEITIQTTDKPKEGIRKEKELLITIVHFKTYAL